MDTSTPGFVTAVNRNGVKQYIPMLWLDPTGPFAGQFKLPPSARKAAAAEKTAKKAATTKTPPVGGDKKEAPSWP